MELSSIENELFMAIDRGNVSEVEKYLKAGADLTVVNNQRDNVLHTYFKSLLTARKPFEVKQSYYEANGGTSREVSVLNTNWQRELNRRRLIFDVLLEHVPVELLNARDKEGFTPLLRAVEMSFPYEAKRLYFKGADLSLRTLDYHFGVLEMATYQNDLPMLDFFYQEVQKAKAQQSSLSEGTKNIPQSSFYRHRNLMMVACMKGNIEALKYLYQAEPERVNDQDSYGDTAAQVCLRTDAYGYWVRLHAASLEPKVSRGQLLCLDFLLSKGIRVDLKNLEGRTLLDCVRFQQLPCQSRVEELYKAQTGYLPKDVRDIQKIRQQQINRVVALKQNEMAIQRRKAYLAALRKRNLEYGE